MSADLIARTIETLEALSDPDVPKVSSAWRIESVSTMQKAASLLADALASLQADRASVVEAARLSAMYLATGFIECPRCGEEVETKNTDAEYTLRRALADAGEPVKQESWRPIESAPKDGTVVWFFEPHDMGGFMFAGSVNADGVWINNLDLKVQNPTHWRPLPPPPQNNREAEYMVHQADFNASCRIADNHLRRRWFETEASLLARRIKLGDEIYNALQSARTTPPQDHREG